MTPVVRELASLGAIALAGIIGLMGYKLAEKRRHYAVGAVFIFITNACFLYVIISLFEIIFLNQSD